MNIPVVDVVPDPVVSDMYVLQAAIIVRVLSKGYGSLVICMKDDR